MQPDDILAGRRQIDVTLDPKKLNLFAAAAGLILLIPLLFLYVAVSILRYGVVTFAFGSWEPLLLLIAMLLLIVAHELLHALGYYFKGKSKTKFGIMMP